MNIDIVAFNCHIFFLFIYYFIYILLFIILKKNIYILIPRENI